MATNDPSADSQQQKQQQQRPEAPYPYPLPRVTIQFCTQCKWMLRAAYFAQELLSTFSTALGEVALQPSTGGTFVVELIFVPPPSEIPTESKTEGHNDSPARTQRRVLWDRKVDGGFPETKELKRRVRDAIEPGRNLGHVDRDHAKPGKAEEAEGRTLLQQQQQQQGSQAQSTATDTRGNDSGGSKACEDCQ